jgi:hypothetical protein
LVGSGWLGLAFVTDIEWPWLSTKDSESAYQYQTPGVATQKASHPTMIRHTAIPNLALLRNQTSTALFLSLGVLDMYGTCTRKNSLIRSLHHRLTVTYDCLFTSAMRAEK